ncbi:MAG: serpin family protein, partial [Bacilli bacterium]|nr:serpin family protein [Bacilli bacterium]
NEDKTTKYVDLLEGLYYPGKVYVGDKFKTFYTKTSADYQLSFLVPDIDVPIFDVFTEQNILEMANREYERLNVEEKKSYMTNVLFPEFNATFDASVKTNFYNDLGIRKVFVPNIADFSNINENIPLFVSDINQKTSFSVNKTGIEGASVSGVTVAPISPVPEYEIINDTFIVNRSFGFVLTKDKNILFSGVVQKI